MAKRMLGMPARIAGSLPIKKKFLLVFLGAVGLPILLAAVLSLSFFIDISTKNARAMLDDKLKLAELLYKNLTQMLHSTANTLAADNLVRLDLQLMLYEAIGNYIASTEDVRGSTFTAILDASGRVRAWGSSVYPNQPGPEALSSELRSRVAEGGQAFFAARLFESEFLGKALGDSGSISDGLVLIAAVKIQDDLGSLIGYALAGYLFSQPNGRTDEYQVDIREQLNCPYLIIDDDEVFVFSDGDAPFRIAGAIASSFPLRGPAPRINIGGDTFMISWFPISGQGSDAIARFVIAYPETDILAARNQTVLNILSIILLGTVVATVVAFALAGAISKAIVSVSKAAVGIAEGHFDVRIPEVSSDEIGTLAKEFNLMTAELQRTLNRLETEKREHQEAESRVRVLNEALEDRVAERTQELNAANSALCKSLEFLKSAQAQLVESEKMAALGTMVSGMAHELNTPLGTSITAASFIVNETRTFTSRFEKNQITKSELGKYLSKVGEGGSIIEFNLHRAASQVRVFKQVAGDQETEALRALGVKEFVDDIFKALSPNLRTKRITMENIIPEKIKIETYPGALYQMIANLVMNSFLHGFENREAGHIRIAGHLAGSVFMMEYSDDGIGISESIKKHIFEPFFTTKRGKGGTGLGLSIVFNLITVKCRGKIECESVIGGGALFRITVPTNISEGEIGNIPR